MHFGNWLKEERRRLKKTQAECAEAAGMKTQYWNNIENHVKQPEEATVRAIAQGLGIDEEIALTAAGYRSNSEYSIDPELAAYIVASELRIPASKRSHYREFIKRQVDLAASAFSSV